MMKNNKTIAMAIGYALLAALLYGFSSPLSKLLLNELSPILLSSLLYFGAGFGMLFIWLIRQSHQKTRTNAPIKAKDTHYVLAMIALDIVAPFLLMMGLLRVNASTVSLLNNFEIVFTALIAMIFFKEIIGKKMWMAIILILIAGGLLAVDDWSAINLSTGALYVVGAGLCWGLETNCTRKLS
jgi:drug/metabolite transporter (DMT)-like permease